MNLTRDGAPFEAPSGQKDQAAKKILNTYNSGYSLVVTHLTTNPPVRCLNRAERTGSLVFNVLWSYVTDTRVVSNIIHFDYDS
jgi:hypothetical protein